MNRLVLSTIGPTLTCVPFEYYWHLMGNQGMAPNLLQGYGGVDSTPHSTFTEAKNDHQKSHFNGSNRFPLPDHQCLWRITFKEEDSCTESDCHSKPRYAWTCHEPCIQSTIEPHTISAAPTWIPIQLPSQQREGSLHANGCISRL